MWCALIAPIWLALMLCAHWEPIVRDTWGHFLWHVHIPFTPSAVWQFAYDSYMHNNPRIGQTLTWLIATPGPWHAIVTPIVELALFAQLSALALGRWPSVRSTTDALLFAMVVALVFATARQLGPMLFYQPFTGNYLFGHVISLALVLPYRFHFAEPRPRGWSWIAIALITGVFAGLSNEHTAPTCAAACVLIALWCWHRDRRVPAWMIAGIVGVIAGGILLYIAPGQSIRYNGIATQQGVLGRIVGRGLVGDLGVAFTVVGYTWMMSFALALGLVAWLLAGKPPIGSAVRCAAAIAAAGVAISVTLIASPKIGQRLYFASSCLVAAAVAGLIMPMLADRRARLVAWLVAGVTIAVILVQCVRVYAVVGPEGADRVDAITHAAEHSVVTVAPYTKPRSRWFLGEDFGVDSERFNIAIAFHLQGILLAGPAQLEPDDAMR
ncbi:MAG TPA: DUF6056 family protein [Kofleriaceae bacterium]